MLEAKIRAETIKYEGLPVALSGGVDSSTLAAFIKPEFVVSVQLPGDVHNEIQYSKAVAEHLNLKHIIIVPNEDDFDEYFEEAVKAIGRPIPHFNIFPLFCMYKKLAEMGVKKLVLGDGPDETMSGYTRNLIMNYLYDVFSFDAFKPYEESIKKVLPSVDEAYAKLTGKPIEEITKCFNQETSLIRAMNRVDIDLMRPDMDDMSNKIARHFGIQNIRPYQDNLVLDNYMLHLPDDQKINPRYPHLGKYALREIASKYLPLEIAWRAVKVGGPVYPVNHLKGWLENGEFDKTKYLELQEKILEKA